MTNARLVSAVSRPNSAVSWLQEERDDYMNGVTFWPRKYLIHTHGRYTVCPLYYSITIVSALKQDSPTESLLSRYNVAQGRGLLAGLVGMKKLSRQSTRLRPWGASRTVRHSTADTCQTSREERCRFEGLLLLDLEGALYYRALLAPGCLPLVLKGQSSPCDLLCIPLASANPLPLVLLE